LCVLTVEALVLDTIDVDAEDRTEVEAVVKEASDEVGSVAGAIAVVVIVVVGIIRA